MTEVQNQPWGCSFLTKDEFNTLSQDPIQIVNRAELKIRQLKQSLETITARSSTDSTNSEQLFQQLETKYVECKKDYDNLFQENNKFRNEIQLLTQKNTEYLEEVNRLKQISLEKESRANTLGKLYDELHQEKLSLHNIIERKEKDLREETEAVTKLTERLNESIKSKAEISSKMLTLENEKTSNEYLIIRLKQEITELKNQNQHLNESCEKHTKHYFNELKEIKSILTETTGKADMLQDENQRLSNSIKTKQSTIEDLEKSMDKYQKEIKSLRDQIIQNSTQFEHELDIQKRLVSLYKDGQEESAKKVTSLHSQIDNLKEVDRKLRAEHEQAYKKMEDAYDSLQENYQRVCKEYDEYKQQNNNSGNGGNSNGNNSTPDLSQMEVPVLSEPVKKRIQEVVDLGSREDIRRELLDMVVRYDDLTKLSLQEKREKRFLQDNLEHVLREVEKKAPIIHEKNKEHQRLLKSQEKLLNSYQALQLEKDTLSLKITTITTENSKLKQENTDLQKQVRNLLKEALDTNRSFNSSINNNSTLVPDQFRRSSLSSSSLTPNEVDQIIPDSLVTFSTIEELQIRNQELLRNVRNLTQDLALHSQNDKKLEMAIQELNVLRSSRERQAEAIQSLVKQRDYFKNLTQNSGLISMDDISSPMKSSFSSFVKPTDSTSTSSVSSPPGGSEEDRKELEKIQKSYRDLQQEYEQYVKDKSENEKSLQSRLDILKESSTTSKISLAQADSQITLLNERNQMLTSSVDSQKKELDSYREKNSEYMQIIIKHQQSLENQRTTNSQLQEQCRQLESKISNFKSENEILKASEVRLLETNKWLSNEKANLETIITTVNAMNSTKEGAELELRRKLENDLNNQETTRIGLKKELDEERQAHKDDLQSLNHQLSESRERYEKKEKEIAETKEKLLKYKIQEQNLQQKISTLENQITTNEVRFNSLLERSHQVQQQQSSTSSMVPSTSSVGSNTGEVSLDLSLARSEIESLKESLSQEKENVIHYKSIALSNENDLTKLKEEATKVRVELEEKLKEAIEGANQLQAQLKDQSVRLEKYEQFSSSHKQDIDLIVAERDALIKEKHTLFEKINDLQEGQKQAINEAKIQSEMAQRATENYERQLALHAADIKTLPILRNELQEAKHVISNLTIQMGTSVKTFENAQLSWVEQETLYKSQVQEFEERIKDLKHQNTLLQSQIENFTNQNSKIERMTSMISAQSTSGGAVFDQKEKTINDLRELVQVQSREQKILEVKGESLQQENIRLKQTTQLNQKTIDTLNHKLAELQEHLKTVVYSSKKHDEVVKQLDQMNLFRESNVMLKGEANKLAQQLKETQDRLKETEEKLAPLNQRNKALETETQVLREEIEAQRLEIGNWSTKVEKLLHKYQSIDPEVHQKLQEQFETLTKENQLHTEQYEEVKKQVEEVKKHAKHWKDESKKYQTSLATTKQELEATKKQLEDITNQFNTYKQNSEKVNSESNEKVLTEYKKKLSGISKLVKEKEETLKKTIEEKEKITKESNDQIELLKTRLKLFEHKKQAAAVAAASAATPSTPTPAPVTPAPTTPAPVPTPVTAAPSTPAPAPATAVLSTPTSILTQAPGSPSADASSPIPPPLRKRVLKKPSSALGQIFKPAAQTTATPAVTPAPAVATPATTTTTTTTTNTATPAVTPVPAVVAPATNTTTTTPAATTAPPAPTNIFGTSSATPPANVFGSGASNIFGLSSTPSTNIFASGAPSSVFSPTPTEPPATTTLPPTSISSPLFTNTPFSSVFPGTTTTTTTTASSQPLSPTQPSSDQTMVESPHQDEDGELKDDKEEDIISEENETSVDDINTGETSHVVKKQKLENDAQSTFSDEEVDEEEEKIDDGNDASIIDEENEDDNNPNNDSLEIQPISGFVPDSPLPSSATSSSDTPQSTGKRKLNRNNLPMGIVPALPSFTQQKQQKRKPTEQNVTPSSTTPNTQEQASDTTLEESETNK